MLLLKTRLDDLLNHHNPNVLEIVDGGLRLHFDYFTQRDPQIVFEAIGRYLYKLV